MIEKIKQIDLEKIKQIDLEKIKQIDLEKNLGEKILCGISVVFVVSYLMIIFNVYSLGNVLQSSSGVGNIAILNEFRGISGWFTVLLFAAILGIATMVMKYVVSKEYIKNGRSILMSALLILSLFNSSQVLSFTWRVESLVNRLKMNSSVMNEVRDFTSELQKNGLSMLVTAIFLVGACITLSIIASVFLWNAIKKQAAVSVSPLAPVSTSEDGVVN